MSEIQTEYSRLLMKRSSYAGIEPTINTGATLSDSWGSTDIMVGEYFFNSNDARLWIRSQVGLHEISLSGSAIPYTKECLLYDSITVVPSGMSKSVYIAERDFEIDQIYATSDVIFSYSSSSVSVQVEVNGNPLTTGNTMTIPGNEYSSYSHPDQPTLIFNQINKGDVLRFNLFDVIDTKKTGIKVQFVGTARLPSLTP